MISDHTSPIKAIVQVVIDKEFAPGKPVLVAKLSGSNPDLQAGFFIFDYNYNKLFKFVTSMHAV